MNPIKIILGLIPFALFGLIAPLIGAGPAAALGAVAAVVILLTDLRGGVKLTPLAGVVILAAIAAVGFLGTPAVQHVLADYGRGIATLLLAATILVTAPFVPFTAAYARETVARQYWKSERFASENRRISAAWGFTVLVMGLGHIAASGLSLAGVDVRLIPLLLNWGVPIAAIYLTIGYTKRVIARAQPATS